MKTKAFMLLLVVCLLVGGCTGTTGNPTPRDYLKEESADIFYYEDIVYANVEGIDYEWVEDYTIGKEFCEITRQTTKSFLNKDGTANILPVGTIIYETDTPLYIAILEGKEIPYMAMLEG